jgi:hypothetical protein
MGEWWGRARSKDVRCTCLADSLRHISMGPPRFSPPTPPHPTSQPPNRTKPKPNRTCFSSSATLASAAASLAPLSSFPAACRLSDSRSAVRVALSVSRDLTTAWERASSAAFRVWFCLGDDDGFGLVWVGFETGWVEFVLGRVRQDRYIGRRTFSSRALLSSARAAASSAVSAAPAEASSSDHSPLPPLAPPLPPPFLPWGAKPLGLPAAPLPAAAMRDAAAAAAAVASANCGVFIDGICGQWKSRRSLTLAKHIIYHTNRTHDKQETNDAPASRPPPAP